MKERWNLCIERIGEIQSETSLQTKWGSYFREVASFVLNAAALCDVVDEDFEKWFIDQFNVKLCKLYYKPFNFKRTGCKGCPFNPLLQEQLDIMEKLLPNEKKQCEFIWKPIYDEDRRLGYRLRRIENNE